MQQSVIDNQKPMPELTLKAILLSIVLAAILAASNAYVGLKVGLIVSASIPAAIVAMVLFRFAKHSNILENNIVQTGASASACIASGIVFVTPALLIIKFWSSINYWQTVFVCLAGGILGVLFSIPLRRALLTHEDLRFPEGRAIAEVLKVNEGKDNSLGGLFSAGIVGALVQFCQQGLQVMTGDYGVWFRLNKVIAGLGLGFDITMIGAGYIIGFNVGLSMILGACVGFIFGMPILSYHFGIPTDFTTASDFVAQIWTTKIRYIGIGTMLVGGIWSLILCVKPIIASLKFSNHKSMGKQLGTIIPRTERDIPIKYAALGVFLVLVMIGGYLFYQMQELQLGLSTASNASFFIITLLYLVFAGFVFSAITAYFSGLIGMSASPVSAVNIAILILISLILDGLLVVGGVSHAVGSIFLHAAAIAIIITAVLACASCMSNGTIQDLKTGELLGATPWKLQVILIIGVVVSTLVVPPVIELLFNAYGIAGVFPRAGMDPSQVLGAPQASLIAAVAQGVFFHNLPFKLIYIGAGFGIAFIILNQFIKRYTKPLSVIAFAIGIYLPMAVTFPIFIGSLISLFMSKKHKQQIKQGLIKPEDKEFNAQRTLLMACGLVAGGSIMGLCLSIPFAIKGNTEVLSIVPSNFTPIAAVISSITTLLVCIWMYRAGVKIDKKV